ncbi:thioredoxin domain-containing protein 5 homolog [Anthonomus grandis grandis]|uniref:thioredoxin domain-containing protein 5 homolog n=1 Tax=Anthonomus grandis grandis TaxID=2921223 RepID=UPI0021667402|nr:thioredoxin domain-containing protein 5 homolog [Anthonomus grandis grandis]
MYLLANVFLIFSVWWPQMYAHEEGIRTHKYTINDFDDQLTQKHHFIMFYAPWCGHCQRLAPTWEQLAEMLNEDDSNIRIAKVDCTTDAKICSDQDITGYPTLKFFKSGEKDGIKFKGTRDLPTLTNFINEQLRESDENPPEAVMKKTSPLTELDEQNFDAVISKGKSFIKFYAPWCGHCQRLAPIWMLLAQAYEFNEAVTIGKIDCTEHRKICTKYEIKGYPTLLWFENGQKIEKYPGERTLDGFKKYVENKSKTAEPVAYQPVEEQKNGGEKEAEEPVIEITAQSFREDIKSGITFVDFFSPWCGHCKRLVPTWELLGKHFQSTSGIKIAKVDCTVPDNREFCNEQEINGFPTLYLYKDGQKISEYNGNRGLDDLADFVNQHLAHDEL